MDHCAHKGNVTDMRNLSFKISRAVENGLNNGYPSPVDLNVITRVLEATEDRVYYELFGNFSVISLNSKSFL